MTIKNLNLHDCDSIVQIHLKSFPNFQLSALGSDFLKIFYKSIIKNDTSVAKGLFINDELVAFAVGTRNSHRFYSNILFDNFFSFLFILVPICITSPVKIFRLIRSFFSFNGNVDEYSKAVLLSIGVYPDKQGKGLGNSILYEFEKEIFNFTDTIILTTDRFNNDNVNSFYIKNGYFLLKSFCQGQRQMNYYYKNKN